MNSYRILEIAKQYTEYDMIQIHTDLPNFPELRTRLLFAFLDGNTKLSSTSELFTLVTALVELGLDTHDMVSVSNEIKEKKAARSRQLKVLAGDYFSARFYHLLAQAGQINMISKISSAICEVNRFKMSMYVKMKQLKLTAEDYVSHMVEIKSQLFLSFSDVISEAYEDQWADAMRGFARCELLMEELFRTESLGKFKWSWGYWYIMQHGTREERKQLQVEEIDPMMARSLLYKYQIAAHLNQLFHTHWQQVRDRMKMSYSDKLLSELFHIWEPFVKIAGNKPKVLEEI
ncbi:heptaprenyl diphosphate synthase component 1 [Paenibacillus roseipurpureus]|uniref:Heptaprenyl diphosphate synthase component 1 n=1 Tax=Paenibacillus roseopurpureus TaxID=2918901 RepID=A0AA96LIL4_9BACL|nr:heptaprenyl diphosphate synthase component 1 [Paenibacillus sp. MBLB1832]WNR42452.1 heptaprenyl diphosphate synthase component 1 [Paenibacillus sp. MBLB1832]